MPEAWSNWLQVHKARGEVTEQLVKTNKSSHATI